MVQRLDRLLLHVPCMCMCVWVGVRFNSECEFIIKSDFEVTED